MSRFLCFVLLIFSLIGVTERGTADDRVTVGDTVFLAVRDPDPKREANRVAPMLARELVRQAFLIAARDECGLATRDATLREEFPVPPTPRTIPFQMMCGHEALSAGADSKFELHYSLTHREAGLEQKLWDWKTEIAGRDLIPTLATQAESLSRGELKQLLQRKSNAKPIMPARPSAEVPHDAQDELFAWNEFAVLGGLRRIHAEIREHGESPELVAALAVGYANLAELTAYYLSPATKAFMARSLLYAERLVHETDGSAWALWHRAYVRAMVGLHNLAADDVAAAKKKPAASPASANRPLPFWTTIIEELSQGHWSHMAAAAKTEQERLFARYANLDVVMWARVNDLTIKSANDVIAICPDCFRAWDALCTTGEMNAYSLATSGSFHRFSASIRMHLPNMPGIPESIAKRLRESPPLQGESEEIPWRNRLITELKEAGTYRQDRMEPSLAVLGQFIEESQLIQVKRQLFLEVDLWHQPADETIARFRPLVQRHRYGGIVGLFSHDAAERDRAADAIKRQIDLSELGYIECDMVLWAGRYHPSHYEIWGRAIHAHTDFIYRDEMIGLGANAVSYWGKAFMHAIEATSSKSPIMASVQVLYNWEEFESRAPQIEKDFGDDPIVMRCLTHQYLKVNEPDDAERCAKRWIHIAPEYAGYEALATVYKNKDDMTAWQKTLEQSLELPDPGFEHAQIRNRIAEYHMGRKEWKEALPYADAAAKSDAQWAVLTACVCHEMLGEWEKAESLMRTHSQRYEGSAFNWMLWCYRTGHGDAKAAQEHARKHIESFGPTPSTYELERLGTYYEFMHQPEKALAAWKQHYEQTGQLYSAFEVATLADGLNNTAERDAYLGKIIERGQGQGPNTVVGSYVGVVRLLMKTLPPGSPKDFDADRADALIAGAPANAYADNLYYFIGMFLKNREDRDTACKYLIRSATSIPARRYSRALASQVLRELKIPIPTAPEKASK